MTSAKFSLLESIKLPKEITPFLVKSFHKKNKQEKKEIDYQKRQLQQKHTELESELETLAKKLSKGIIKDDLFLKMSNKIEKEQSGLRQQITHLTSKEDVEKIDRFFLFLEKAKDKFIKGTLHQKKKVLTTIGSNFTLKDKELLVDLHKPFLVLQKHRKHLSLRNK